MNSFTREIHIDEMMECDEDTRREYDAWLASQSEVVNGYTITLQTQDAKPQEFYLARKKGKQGLVAETYEQIVALVNGCDQGGFPSEEYEHQDKLAAMGFEV